MARAIADHFPGRSVGAVVGMARDKQHRGFLRELEPVVEEFLFTAAGNPRAADPGRLVGATDRPARVSRNLEEALETIRAGRYEVILLAGSFVLVGEAYRALGIRVDFGKSVG